MNERNNEAEGTKAKAVTEGTDEAEGTKAKAVIEGTARLKEQ